MNGSTRPVQPVDGKRVPREADYGGTTPFTGDSGAPATFQGRVRAAAFPALCALSLGAEPGQIDISAAVIRLFERLGWATGRLPRLPISSDRLA